MQQFIPSSKAEAIRSQCSSAAKSVWGAPNPRKAPLGGVLGATLAFFELELFPEPEDPLSYANARAFIAFGALILALGWVSLGRLGKPGSTHS